MEDRDSSENISPIPCNKMEFDNIEYTNKVILLAKLYDLEKNEFYFELTKNINKEKHKLVKNYLAFTDDLLRIESNNGYNVKLTSGIEISTNPDHKFAIYNNDTNKFEMIQTSEIDINIHFLVNTFKL